MSRFMHDAESLNVFSIMDSRVSDLLQPSQEKQSLTNSMWQNFSICGEFKNSSEIKMTPFKEQKTKV